MKWKTKINNKEYAISLPDKLVAGVVFDAKVEDQSIKFKVVQSKPLELMIASGSGWSRMAVKRSSIQTHPLGHCEQQILEYSFGQFYTAFISLCSI